MPTEDHSSERSRQGLPQGGGVELSLDELAKGLATGTCSRGKALRLMGAALVGGALASLGIGEAGADPPGCKRNGKSCKNNSQCCSANCDSDSGTCADAPPPGPICTPDCPTGCFCENLADGSGTVCFECTTGFGCLIDVASCEECTGETPICIIRPTGQLLCVRPC